MPRPAQPAPSQEAASLDTAGLAGDLGMDVDELIAKLADPFWRLTGGMLYQIRSEDGEPIPFIPTPQQLAVIEEIYNHGARTLVIPKARQVRMSTVIAMIVLDTVLFGSSVQCSLCDIDIPNADRKLDEKVFFAFERLPERLRHYWTPIKKTLSPGIFTIQHGNDTKSKSTFYAGQKARGGTNQILWMSEWAELAAKHPAMSAEYLRGAWPAAAEGIRIIESTWYGGKSGDVWGIAKKGLDPHTGLPLPREKCTPRTPRVMFFPWYVIAARRLPCAQPSLIRPEVRAYFAKALEGSGDTLDDDQMYWYQEEVLDIYHHEAQYIYPTNIHECWNANIEGSIWGAALGIAKAAGRVGNVPHRPDLEVDTFWDLGAPENSPCLYVQHDHEQRRFINLDAEIEGGEVADRVRLLKEKGYRYGTHYLPHDAGQRQKNGKTYFAEFEAELKAQGVSGRVVQLKQTGNKWLGINHFTGLLKKSVWIDDKKCAFLLESIAAYRRKPDSTRENKFLDDIVSDWSAHACLDGDTPILTPGGWVALRQMRRGDAVSLPGGRGQVSFAGPTSLKDCYEIMFDDETTLISSGEHKFFTENGLERCDVLRYNSEVWTLNHPTLQSLNSKKTGLRESHVTNSPAKTCEEAKGSRLAKESSSTATTTVLTQKPAITTAEELKNDCIRLSGSITTALCQRVCTFITRTTTNRIMTSPIWRYLPFTNTFPITLKQASGSDQPKISLNSHSPKSRPKSGTPPPRAESGTACTVLRYGRAGNPWKRFANNAKNLIKRATRAALNSVATTAKLITDGAVLRGRKNINAHGAEMDSWPLMQQDGTCAAPSVKTVLAHGTGSSAKRVIAIRPLGKRMLYDMTVEHHHAYCANGVMVSNCDAARYVSEAFMEGHLPHTSNGIMANLYFDPTRLQTAAARLPEHPPGLWSIDHAGQNRLLVAARQDPAGWLRVWETPLQGPLYLVCIVNGAVGVWRTAGWDITANAERPARLVAACVDEGGINQDKLYLWASLAAVHYGHIPVIADTTSLPGSVERLRELGAGVAARQQSLAERRVGQATAIRKPGHEFGEAERKQGYAQLQELWRDGGVEIWCPTTLRQMGGVTITEQGGFEVLSGYQTHWLDMCALGVMCLGLASPAARPMARQPGAGSEGYRDEEKGLPSGFQRRKLY